MVSSTKSKTNLDYVRPIKVGLEGQCITWNLFWGMTTHLFAPGVVFDDMA